MLITIGRECGCGADEIGKMLSEKYQLPCYMKSNIIAYAKEKGLYDNTVVVLNENKMLFLLKTASVDVLKDTLSKVSLEQANNLAQYAIDHQINDFEKADIIKARTGRDITKSILLERENKVD